MAKHAGTSPAVAVGGVRASWWNSVVSLVVAVVAAHIPVVVYVSSSGSMQGSVTAGLVGIVSLTAQLATIPWFRSGLGGGVPLPLIAAVALGSGAGLWAALPSQVTSAIPLISALSLVACLLRPPLRTALLPAAAGLAVASWLLGREEYTSPAAPVLGVAYPYLVYASVWAWDVVTRLDAARATESDLAVARERLRFASDLHDIQGHSLQVIALKAELAERLVATRPEAAAEQMAQVRSEAADALARTRELARGYRSTGIEDELDNARDILSAAGFECTTQVGELPRGGEVRSLLGRALREATTNVLRHAAPGPVHIALGRRSTRGADGEWSLVVGNRIGESSPPGAGVRPADGAGIAGLAERAEQLGGGAAAEVDDDGGRFVLTVTVPERAGQGLVS